MSAFHAGSGFAAGLLGVGLAIFAVRPAPEAPPSVSVQPRPTPPPTRVVHRSTPCPPAIAEDTPQVERSLQMLRTREALLRGQLSVETGEPLPPPTPEESPDAVAAFLDEHRHGGDLELDCSEHPCRGRLTLPATMNNDNQRFRDAVYERFPDSVLIDSIAVEDLEAGRLPGITVTFVLAKGLQTDGQRRRVQHIYEQL